MQTLTQAASEPDLQRRPRGGKFLAFALKDEEYGLEILKVQEIIGLIPVTPVPHTPAEVLGLINLRGLVIPVIDLRRKFGFDSGERSSENCIIVVRTSNALRGVVVDRVSEVLDISEQEIDDPPDLGADVRTEFLLGIGKSQGKVRLLVDIDRAITGNEDGRGRC